MRIDLTTGAPPSGRPTFWPDEYRGEGWRVRAGRDGTTDEGPKVDALINVCYDSRGTDDQYPPCTGDTNEEVRLGPDSAYIYKKYLFIYFVYQ